MQQEQIIRTATKIGNGAHIFVPKQWTNEEIILIRTPKLKLKEEIIKIIEPYLENIIGVFLYGSYARDEQEEQSDIDLLLITNKKIKVKNKGKFDTIVIEKSKLEKAIKLNPILMYSIIKEAKPIINSSLLEELKKLKIIKNQFKEFIEGTKRIIKIDKEIIELDKLDGEDLISISVIYSLILRLRGIFIINSLIKKQKYSNKIFKKWLNKNIEEETKEIYIIYQNIRDNKKIKTKIKISTAEKLLNLLEKEVKKYDK